MFRPQFSVASLLGVVTFAAVACAALVKPSEWWASFLVTTTVVAIVAAGLSAWFRLPRRMFAAGFAIVGRLYLWLLFGHGFSTTIGPRLLTTKALVYAETKWHGEGFNDLISPQGVGTTDFDVDGYVDLFVANRLALYTNNGNGTFKAVSSKDCALSSPFHVIGQSLWTWIMAAAVGWFAAHWHARRHSETLSQIPVRLAEPAAVAEHGRPG
jgi:hypothetical protein